MVTLLPGLIEALSVNGFLVLYCKLEMEQVSEVTWNTMTCRNWWNSVPAAAGHAGSSSFMALLLEMCLPIFESCAEYRGQMRFLMAAAILNCFKPLTTTPDFLAGQRGAFAARIACARTPLGGEREQTGDRMWYWHQQEPSPLAPIYPSA